ncbi:MAG TPA: ABC transporter ATP-binding protein [Cytophagaceae bacterium]
MNTTDLCKIHELFMELYKISYNKKEVETQFKTVYPEGNAFFEDFLNQLFESGALTHLAYFRNWFTEADLKTQMDEMNFPMLLFYKQNYSIRPIIVFRDNGSYFKYTIEEGEFHKSLLEETDSNIFLKGAAFSTLPHSEDKILGITCFPNEPIYSKSNDQSTEGDTKLKTFQRFLSLLKSEKREIGYIYIYAIISGIIGLSLPLGIQSIIGFISSGQVTTSVVVLISFVVLGILITGALQVMQLSIVERIQQRIFTKTSFEFAFRIPKIKIESVLRYYPPELMNRFFDIMTLQKGLTKILLGFSAATFQVILGLILLSFYHSSFIFFGIFLVTILSIIIRYTGAKGLTTSLKESKYKYMVANWLEEVARSLSTFKLAGYANLPMEKTDYFVSNYLYARRSHYKVLISQYISFVAFKTIITGGLLILGCVLLVEKQINIGQFVASEIIIILIMNAVEKIITQLDTVYDVLTSIEKIGTVTDFPIEIPKGINIQNTANNHGISITLKDLKYRYPTEPEYILKGINLEVMASERICISGYSSSGKTTLINIILGFLTSYEGVLAYNNMSLRSLNKNSLIDIIGDNVSQEDLFDGTLLENITLGRNNITVEKVLWALDCVGLSEYVQSQHDGVYTQLTNGRLGISESVARKIIIARSIVKKPKLLILEDFLMGLEKEGKLKLIDTLLGKEFKWTLIIISNDEDMMKRCDRTVIMKQGRIIAQGPYNEIKQDSHFSELI